MAYTLDGAKVTISDWFLSFLKARNETLYGKVMNPLLHQFDKKQPELSKVFELLLEHVGEIMKMLADAKAARSVVMKVPNPNQPSGDGQGEWLEKTKKLAEVLREAEDFFIVLLELADTLDSTAENSDKTEPRQKSGKASGGSFDRVNELIKIISGDGVASDLFEFRLRILMLAYNVVHPRSKARAKAFGCFLTCASTGGLFQTAAPYLDMFYEAYKDWDLSADKKLEFFALIGKELAVGADNASDAPAPAADGRERGMYALQLRHAEACDGEDAKILNHPNTIATAVSLIRNAIHGFDYANFNRILQRQIVSNLQKTNNKNLYKLFGIFVRGSPDDLAKFHQECPAAFADAGLDFELCLSNARLLALTSLAAKFSASPSCRGVAMTIANVAKSLGLDEAAAERLIVQAINLDLIDGKIDQIERVVKITSASQREIGPEQWEMILSRLRIFLNNFDGQFEAGLVR